MMIKSANVTKVERQACVPEPLIANGFNKAAILPYGLKVEYIRKAMQDFLDFIALINLQLHKQKMSRFEKVIMQANFSSLVGEFVKASIPRYCRHLVQNKYHNGHPDLIPAGVFPGDSVQHASEGIEIKSSRYYQGWQGHNPEDTWLMVFVYDSNSPEDAEPIRPFSFKMVVGAPIKQEDWAFSGRKGASRRTITASVKKSGRQKMKDNWIYYGPGVSRTS
jgi:hypothetical protein